VRYQIFYITLHYNVLDASDVEKVVLTDV